MFNINMKTGIAFGFISANTLNSDTVNDLLYGPQAVNTTYNAALADYITNEQWAHNEQQEEERRDKADLDEEFMAKDFDEEYHRQKFTEDYNSEEETIEGQMDCPGYDKVAYCTGWLGGALNFFIASSPFTTDKARKASPCVPNAGILDTLDGNVTSYDVPANWRKV